MRRMTVLAAAAAASVTLGIGVGWILSPKDRSACDRRGSRSAPGVGAAASRIDGSAGRACNGTDVPSAGHGGDRCQFKVRKS